MDNGLNQRLKTFVLHDLGGEERRFQLKRAQIRELQQTTGCGIGGLFRRLREEAYHLDDIRETIRLGLIGGGMEPHEALILTRHYVDDRPIGENLLLAALILHAINVGLPEEEPDSEKRAPATAGST